MKKNKEDFNRKKLFTKAKLHNAEHYNTNVFHPLDNYIMLNIPECSRLYTIGITWAI